MPGGRERMDKRHWGYRVTKMAIYLEGWKTYNDDYKIRGYANDILSEMTLSEVDAFYLRGKLPRRKIIRELIKKHKKVQTK